MISMNLDSDLPKPRRVLLKQGWKIFTILDGSQTLSKTGREMLVFTMQELETEHNEKIYCILEPGKRWLLKTILEAVDIKKDQDGNYNFDIPDLIGKKLAGFVEHQDNVYINKQGIEVKGIKHQVVEFKKFESNQTGPHSMQQLDEIQWKD